MRNLGPEFTTEAEQDALAVAYEDRLERAVEVVRGDSNYRVLRRFSGYRTYIQGYDDGEVTPAAPRLGLFVDCETTGLDPETDEIIQIAILPFTFDNEPEGGERILAVQTGYVGYEQPKTPITPEITEITGITNAMVEGLRFDDATVNAFFKDGNAALVIAHKADFDRPRIERRFPLSDASLLPWGCSLNEVDWTHHYGAVARSLGAALGAAGEFSDEQHDALEDCRIGVHVPATATREVPCPNSSTLPCPQTSGIGVCRLCAGSGVVVKTAFNDLLRSARVPTVRLWASFPFDERIQGRVKARKYRWNDGRNGKPKAWFRDVRLDQVADERSWLHGVDPNIEILFTRYNARDRWSNRV